MPETTTYALLATALATALFHTLIPDHWLPFVLIGRARGWSVARTASVSGLSALIHAVVSLVLGLAALGLGLTAASAIGEGLVRASTVMLVLFGLGYAFWAWRKGGHFHPGGSLAHRWKPGAGCAGDEGDANPEHLHYHADESWIAGRSDTGSYWLALIVGANPCILLVPLVVAAAQGGALSVTLVCVAYSVPTVLLMVGLSVLGVASGRQVKLPRIARHMESLSGLLIAAMGLLLLYLDH